MSKDKELYRDPIRERLIGFIENAYEQKNNIFNVVIGVFIIIGLISYYNYSNNTKIDEANSAFSVAQNSYINGMKDFALNEFKNIAIDYSGENAGNLAELFIAAESLSSGDLDDADSRLLGLSGKFEVDVLNTNIKAMRADIALSKEKYDLAIELYDDAITSCLLLDYKVKYQIGKLFALQAKGEHNKVIELINTLLENSEITNNNRNSLEELMAYSKHLNM